MQTSFSADQLRDPAIADADRVLRTCVHYGFCTATCPTYVLTRDENDSPRGRIDLIRAMLERMVERNPTRADYLEKFETLIESYNVGSRNIEEMFQELMALSQTLSAEQQRHVREQLGEDELAIFDLLTRPGPDLSPAERDEVKKVAKLLLQRVREAVVLDWRSKAQARARVRETIAEALDDGLPRAYTPELYEQKVSSVFEHVYEGYTHFA